MDPGDRLPRCLAEIEEPRRESDCPATVKVAKSGSRADAKRALSPRFPKVQAPGLKRPALGLEALEQRRNGEDTKLMMDRVLGDPLVRRQDGESCARADNQHCAHNGPKSSYPARHATASGA